MVKFIPPPSGNLPKAGKKELAEVYAACRAQQTKSEPKKGMCAALAWKAVEEEYYKRAGKWVKRKV